MDLGLQANKIIYSNLKERKMNRKQRRAKAKIDKKLKNESSEVAEKIAMFDKIPDECLACTTSFDKKNRSQVMSWNVVVRNDLGQVRLYCPDCWKKARDVVQAYEKENGYG
jgi:ribosomal protein L44E